MCSTQSDLKKHIKQVHYKIKDFECPSCDFKCSTQANLKRHIKNFTGERNISGGELQIIKALKDLGFEEDEDYYFNQTFSELTQWSGHSLRPDFMFIDHKIIIEYDGRQHFQPVTFGGISEEKAREAFYETNVNDKLKDDFCEENGYKMIRINYKDFPKVLEILSTELFDIVDWTG